MVLKWERASTSFRRYCPRWLAASIVLLRHRSFLPRLPQPPCSGGAMRLGSFAKLGDGSFSNFSSLLREGQATLASASCSSLSLTWRLCECPYQMWLCMSGIFPLHRRRLDPRAGLPEYCLRSSSPRWLSCTLQPRALKTARVRHLVLTLHSVLRHFTHFQREGWHEYTV